MDMLAESEKVAHYVDISKLENAKKIRKSTPSARLAYVFHTVYLFTLMYKDKFTLSNT